MAWAAELRNDGPTTTDSLEERIAGRRKLYLGARASTGPKAAEVLIHNLSATGMLLETSIELVGQGGIEVEIPEAGTVHASIVWNSDGFYGCQFEQPLSRAAVSAATLRAPGENAAANPAPSPSPMSILTAAYPPQVERHRDPHALSPRAKVAVIAGLAAASWAVVLSVVSLVA